MLRWLPRTPPVDAATAQPWFAFAPSNIALEQLRLSNVSDLGAAVMDSSSCEVDVQGESGAIRCLIDPNTIGTVGGPQYLKIRVVDGPLLDVFVARSWTITARTSLPARGLVVLVALEDIVIEGTVDLTGGAIGAEPGMGPMGDFRVGAGGGGFCGRGGAGAYSSLGRSTVYGTAELIPPRVGSAGGPGRSPERSGRRIPAPARRAQRAPRGRRQDRPRAAPGAIAAVAAAAGAPS